MVNRSKVRVGVIGCGLVAQVMPLPHLRELRDRFAVEAVCDLASGPLEFAGAMFPDARRLTAWEDVLGEVDALLVLTAGSPPPVAIAPAQAGVHRFLGKPKGFAAGAGVHVFVEKPMCFAVEEGEAMIAAAKANGVVLMVGYMKRYDPSYEALLGHLDGMTFARITTLESPIEPYAVHHPLSERTPLDPETLSELQADDERRLRAGLGRDDAVLLRTYKSVLLDSMVHELNGVRGLLGEPSALHSVRIFDTGVTVSASFGGVEAVFAWVDLPGIARYAQDWSFYGPDRRASLEFPSPLLRSHPTRLVFEEGEPGGVASRRTEHVVSYEEAFKRELVEFHAAIAEGRAARTDGEDGLRDVALCRDIVLHHAA